MRCPNPTCGSQDLVIDTEVSARVFLAPSTESEDSEYYVYEMSYGDHEWTNEHPCECLNCHFAGTVHHFSTKEEDQPSPLSPEGYAAAGGGCCPACGSVETQQEMDFSASDRRTVVQAADCLSCGAAWDTLYELTGYTGLTMPVPEKEIHDEA